MDPVVEWLLKHPELNGDSAYRKLQDAERKKVKMPPKVRSALKRLDRLVKERAPDLTLADDCEI